MYTYHIKYNECTDAGTQILTHEIPMFGDSYMYMGHKMDRHCFR